MVNFLLLINLQKLTLILYQDRQLYDFRKLVSLPGTIRTHSEVVHSLIFSWLLANIWTMSSYLQKTNLVEGIGDELIYGFAAFIGILIPVITFILTRRNVAQRIHPDSAESVQTAREHMQHNVDDSHQYRTQRENSGDTTCPVCLANAQFAIETNCAHLFCGNCIIAYWQHGHWLGAVHCPVCRGQVTLLMVNFTEGENNENTPEKQNILLHINAYNRRFSGEPRPYMDYIRDLPTLLRHAFSEFFTVGGLVWMFRLRVFMCFIAALLYFISPLDIIPEAAFGLLGFLDDLFILLLLAIYITIIYRQYLQNRADT
ncbi:hypothetical protein ScPMuIL_001152 [Solemya velum]